MGLDKFLKDDKKEELVLTKKDYKSKVNNIVKNTFEKDNLNLLQIEKESTVSKKVPMSVYFEKDDLDLLKAIAFEKYAKSKSDFNSIALSRASIAPSKFPLLVSSIPRFV